MSTRLPAAAMTTLLAACTPGGLALPAPDGPTRIGPERGMLRLSGGGAGVFGPFVEDCGRDAAWVVIPTAAPDGHASVDDPVGHQVRLAARHDLADLTVLHTRDREVADSLAFVEPLERAECVWLSGGRQWRIADAYLGTRTHGALRGVLDRDGVVGGDSAGATMLASFLVRGDTAGNEAMIGDHTAGFGLLRGVAVDQHVTQRDRRLDLVQVLDVEPTLLGLGLDESTWITVRGDRAVVGGRGNVWVHDRGRWPDDGRPSERHVPALGAGEGLDLVTRQVLRR